MSKQIKQMQMDSLRHTFKDVRDLVMLSTTKLSCQSDYVFRSTLRKKNIRLQLVKNSLARRVFDEMGMKIGAAWEGTTVLAWGGSSLADLSKEIEALIKKNDKTLKVKSAVSEGQEISFKTALAMPTKAEAMGRVVSLALAPASRLVSQFLAPASQIAGQIKTLSEKVAEEEPAVAVAG